MNFRRAIPRGFFNSTWNLVDTGPGWIYGRVYLLSHLNFSENVETHSKFCTYTRSLLEVLFGVSTDKAANEPSLMNKMTKVDIVSKTPITFNQDEIYHLLHSSLLE